MSDVSTSIIDPTASRIRSVIVGSPVTIADLGADLRYLAVHNPGRLLDALEVIGRSLEQAHGPAGAALDALARQALASGAPASGLLDLPVSGGPRSFDVRLAPAADGGQLTLLACEASPRASHAGDRSATDQEGFLQRVADLAPGIIYVYDLASDTITFVNRPAVDLMGYNLGRTSLEHASRHRPLVHPDDRPLMQAFAAKLPGLRAGELIEREYRMQHADGSWHWMHDRVVSFRQDGAGNTVQTLCMVFEVTARREAEERQLQEAAREGVMQALVQAMERAEPTEGGLLRAGGAELAGQLKADCMIALLDGDGQGLQPAVWHHADPTAGAQLAAAFGGQLWGRDGPLRRAIVQGERTLSLGAGLLEALDEQAAGRLTRLGLRHATFMPIQAHGRVLGVLGVVRLSGGGPWLGGDEALLRKIGERLALKLDNIRLLQAARQELGERQRAERELSASQRFLQQIIATAPAIVYLFDLTRQQNAFVNEEIGSTLGYSPQQVADMGDRLIPTLLHPDDLAQSPQQIAELLALPDGAIADWEYRMRHADGGWRWLLSRESIFSRADDGAPTQILGMAIDISARKEIEGQLQHSRDLLRAIFDGLSDGLLLLDREGRVLLVNRRLASLLSLEPDGLVGRPWEALVGGRGMLGEAQIGASLDDGQRRSERIRVNDPAGGQRILDIVSLPLLDSAGVMAQLVVHVRDMTEQAQMEGQIMEQERFAANGRLAAIVAHEVNTPLQAIESCLHLAGRVEDPERTRYLRLAREEIKRIGYTLRQLLDLYRPSGPSGPIAINGLIERVLLLTGTSLSRQSIQIERDLGQGLPIITGRADELTQVLINLVFNAMQAMPKGGRLRMETRLEAAADGGRRLAVAVIDSGAGVAPELRQRIFEPFFTTRADGTGLGLSISRKIIEGHGGALDVESAPEQGSSFRILLPLPS